MANGPRGLSDRPSGPFTLCAERGIPSVPEDREERGSMPSHSRPYGRLVVAASVVAVATGIAVAGAASTAGAKQPPENPAPTVGRAVTPTQFNGNVRHIPRGNRVQP